jgi:RNA polymerase sigma-70 factor (ECF subfamily)
MIETGTMSSPVSKADWFATTQWTMVLTAQDQQSPQAGDALEKLCQRYWRPIYVFIRRCGHGPDDAQDLTQAFFARLLEKDYLKAADAAKGRFRTLLLTAAYRFLADERERTHAQKRGGAVIHVSMDELMAEESHPMGLAEVVTPETIFERRWAETVLATVLSRLRQEFESAGQQDRFDTLKPLLATDKQAPSGAEIAAKLGLSESAAYSAVHRLRQRYGELLREEIAHTVASPEDVDEELQYLVRVLGG